MPTCFKEFKMGGIDATRFEVKSPAGPPYDLVVEKIMSDDYNDKSLKKVVVCVVHKSTDPTLKSVLKVIFEENKFNNERQINKLLFQKLGPSLYLPKIYGTLTLQKDPPVYAVHMKYYPRGTIFDALYKPHKVSRLPEAVLKPYFKSVLLSMFSLHKIGGVVHRDVKPQNILVFDLPNSYRSIAFFADFGESVKTTYPMRTVIGGRHFVFCAPEARMSSTYDFKVDIWSLGVTFYTLIFGADPTCQFQLKELYDSQVQTSITDCPQFQSQYVEGKGLSDNFPQTNPPISAELKKILKDMLQDSPKARPTAESLLAQPYFESPELSWLTFNLSH